MKVVAVGHCWVISSYRELLRNFADEGLELTVVVPDYWREGGKRVFAVRERDDNFDLKIIRPIFHRQHVHFYFQLPAVLWKERPDVVFLLEEPNSFITALTALFGGFFLPSSKVVFYSFLNDDRVFAKAGGIRKWLFPLFSSLTFRYSHGAVCASKASEDQMRNRGFQGVMSVIPFGCHLREFGCKRAPVGLTDGDRIPKIGFVGRLTYGKGIDLLLQALHEIQKSFEIQAVIVGDGEMAGDLKRLAEKLHLTGHVDFIGAVSQEDVKNFLREIDILVVPSRRDGHWVEQFGRVIIEGLASGCIVIGSSSGEIPHVIGENGFIFQENDFRDLVRKLYAALNLSGREIEALRKKAAVDLESRFSYAFLAKTYGDLFRRLREAK